MTKSQNQTAVKQYLLSVICGYEDSLTESTDEEKVKGFFDIFYKEYGYRVEKMGLRQSLWEWLRGLPSIISIEFMDYKIIELLKEWKLLGNNSTESKTNKLINRYWDMLVEGLVTLGNKHKAIK